MQHENVRPAAPTAAVPGRGLDLPALRRSGPFFWHTTRHCRSPAAIFLRILPARAVATTRCRCVRRRADVSTKRGDGSKANPGPAQQSVCRSILSKAILLERFRKEADRLRAGATARYLSKPRLLCRNLEDGPCNELGWMSRLAQEVLVFFRRWKLRHQMGAFYGDDAPISSSTAPMSPISSISRRIVSRSHVEAAR